MFTDVSHFGPVGVYRRKYEPCPNQPDSRDRGPSKCASNTMIGLAEATAAEVANIQVATGQTLTNSVKNVAEAARHCFGTVHFDIPLVPRCWTIFGGRSDDGARLADNLSVLYTYRLGVTALSAFESRNFGGWDAIKGATIFNASSRSSFTVRVASSKSLPARRVGYTGIK